MTYGLRTPASGYGYGAGPYKNTALNTTPFPAAGYGYQSGSFGVPTNMGDADVYDPIGNLPLSDSDIETLRWQNGVYDELSGFSLSGLLKGVENVVNSVVKTVPVVGQVVNAVESTISNAKAGKTTYTVPGGPIASSSAPPSLAQTAAQATAGVAGAAEGIASSLGISSDALLLLGGAGALWYFSRRKRR